MKELIVDVSIIWWRNYHAIVKKDDPTNAELSTAWARTLGQIVNVVDSGDYDRVYIAVDHPPYWRKKLYDGYKAQRPPHDPDALAMLRKLVVELKKTYPVLHAKGYEADDIIATVCLAAGADNSVTILSCDKDQYQCLQDGFIRMINTATPAGGEWSWTEARVREEKGIWPSQVPLWLALWGDTSDNIPGVKGIGEKRTVELLQATSATVPEQLVDHEDKFTTATWAAYTESMAREDGLRLSYKLTKLSTDAPILDDLARLREHGYTPHAEPSEPAPEPAAVNRNTDSVNELRQDCEQQAEAEAGELDSLAKFRTEPGCPAWLDSRQPETVLGVPLSLSLGAALLEAQRQISNVGKTSYNKFQKFNYASAESIIIEARKALINAGLLVYRQGYTLTTFGDDILIGVSKDGKAITGNPPMVLSTFVIAHPASGETVTETIPYPVLVAQGRPLDKAINAALSSVLGYWLRDRLLIPRVESEVCSRDDGERQERWSDRR